MLIIPGVAPAEERVAVPEYAVILRRNYERYGDLGVVLVEFFVLAFVVPFVGLMLAEAVECFVVGGGECLADGPGSVTVDFDRGELPGYLFGDRRAVRVRVADAAVRLADRHRQRLRLYYHRLIRLRNRILRTILLRHHHQRHLPVLAPRSIIEGVVVSQFYLCRHRFDVDNVVRDDFDTHRGTVICLQLYSVSGFPDILGTGRGRQAGGCHQYGGGFTHKVGLNVVLVSNKQI